MAKLKLALCAVVAWLVHPAVLQAKCGVGEAITRGDHAYDIDFGGSNYQFTLHVPSMYDSKTPVPLVFDLHGFSGNGPGELALSGWPDVSDRYGFLVVAPTGYKNSWNGDIAFGAAYEAKVDHVGLMKAIINRVADIANINRSKVYSTGLSNGAAMSNTLGCKATDAFAAVAPVADPLDIGRPSCMPARPTSVLGFHGYDDEPVPYDGGAGNGPPLPSPFPNIPDTLKAWAEIMSCVGTPQQIPIQGRSKCEIYRECKDGVEVGYCSLEGGHLLYSQDVLDIADYAWKFFDKHSLPLPDVDGDGVSDADDNCLATKNADQSDANGNCIGDACECSRDADCDDAMYCNGTETCSNGGCAAGEPQQCAAGQACHEDAKECGAAKVDAGAERPADASGSRQDAGSKRDAGVSSPEEAGRARLRDAAADDDSPEQPVTPDKDGNDGCNTSGAGPGSRLGALLLSLALACARRRRGKLAVLSADGEAQSRRKA